MKVIDLFSGLEGWAAPFRQREHEVTTVDFDARFNPTIVADILKLNPSDLPQADIILASPPCETFSVASISTHWGGGVRAYQPKTPAAERGIKLINKTLEIIEVINPKIAIIENPRGVLRNLGIIPVSPQTIWYCHYGERRAKPTDLWGLPFPASWQPRPPCHNRTKRHATPCCCFDHDAAPRGAKTGTQGLPSYATRSEIPYQLALDICIAAETIFPTNPILAT